MYKRQVYDWVDGQARRKPLAVARKLLAEAGWPDGRNAATGEPLVLNLDTTSGGMGDKSRLDWLTRQFAKLDIQLVVRSTDFNRFQEKLRKGAVQLYYLGWNADYPDPENFLFLLAGPEGKVAKGGENASNYANPEFDRLFERLKNMESEGPRGAERLAILRQSIALLQHDAPWIYGFHLVSYTHLDGYKRQCYSSGWILLGCCLVWHRSQSSINSRRCSIAHSIVRRSARLGRRPTSTSSVRMSICASYSPYIA